MSGRCIYVSIGSEVQGGGGGGGSRLHAGLHCRKCGVKGEQFSHTNKPS